MSMCEFCKHFKLGACALDIIECSSNSFTCPRWTADWSQAKPLPPIHNMTLEEHIIANLEQTESFEYIKAIIEEHNEKYNDKLYVGRK